MFMLKSELITSGDMQSLNTMIEKASHFLAILKEARQLVNDGSPVVQHDLEVRVTKILHEMGIPTNIKGFGCVRDAIMMAVNDWDIMNYITKGLYPAIAKKRDTTPNRVERAIRHAIEVAFDRGCASAFEEIFGNSYSPHKGKPTNGEFIATIADKIRLENKKTVGG
jgi:two-component system response regulator (stage 0 sporulation protein A)